MDSTADCFIKKAYKSSGVLGLSFLLLVFVKYLQSLYTSPPICKTKPCRVKLGCHEPKTRIPDTLKCPQPHLPFACQDFELGQVVLSRPAEIWIGAWACSAFGPTGRVEGHVPGPWAEQFQARRGEAFRCSRHSTLPAFGLRHEARHSAIGSGSGLMIRLMRVFRPGSHRIGHIRAADTHDDSIL